MRKAVVRVRNYAVVNTNSNLISVAFFCIEYVSVEQNEKELLI